MTWWLLLDGLVAGVVAIGAYECTKKLLDWAFDRRTRKP